MQFLYHAVALRQTYLLTDFKQVEKLLKQDIIKPYHMLYNLENQHTTTLAECPDFQVWIAERLAKERQEEKRNQKIKFVSLSLFLMSILLAAGKLYINIRFEKPGFDTHPHITSYGLQEFLIFSGCLCLLFMLINSSNFRHPSLLPAFFSFGFFFIQMLAFALTLHQNTQNYHQTKNTLQEMNLLYQSVHTLSQPSWFPENNGQEKNQVLLANLREYVQKYLSLQQNVTTGIRFLSEKQSLNHTEKDQLDKVKNHIRQLKQWSKESERARRTFLQEYFLTIQKLDILESKKSELLQDFDEKTQSYAEISSTFFEQQRATLENLEPLLKSPVFPNSKAIEENISAIFSAWPLRAFPTVLNP